MRARIKKSLCLLLTAAALFGVTACGGAPASSQAQDAAAPDVAEEAVSDGSLRYTQEETVRGTKYEKEPDFADFLAAAEPRFTVPALAQAMVPQGMSYDVQTGLVYISSYAAGDVPSIITATALDTGELQAEYILKNPDGSSFTSHVGGLAVTESMVYVSAKLDNDGSYSIAGVKKAGLPTEGRHEITLDEQIKLPVSPSFMSCCAGVLWIGNFYYPSADYGLSTGIEYTTPTDSGDYGCYVLGYELENGVIPAYSGDFPLPDLVLCAPDRIQGTAVTDSTVVLSQSYGRKNNSALLVYDVDFEAPADAELDIAGEKVPMYVLDSAREVKRLTAMPMTEGLTLTDGGVLVLFESGAMKYSDGRFRTDKVWELNLG